MQAISRQRIHPKVELSMRLSALTWTRYRSFKERQHVALAPLTILIGRNGSGKSVLSRLPLLLSSAVSSLSDGPIDLTAGGIEHASSYQDLVNQKGALPFSLGMEVSGAEGQFGFETTLRYVNETRSLAIEAIILLKNSKQVLSATISNEDQLTAALPTYVVHAQGERRPGSYQIKFDGLLPCEESFDGQLRDLVSLLVNNFRLALPQPSYLGPFRAEPNRPIRFPSQQIPDLGPRGERASELLADDNLRRGGKLASGVSQWFQNFLGQELYVDVTSDLPQIFVRDYSDGLDIRLADTGAGFSQVLPIVVQHMAYRIGRLKSSILIVEQPELHLHPAAHGHVADLIVESSKGSGHWAPATCIVETHSEQFVMRIRRRIAEGLAPDQVALWSLNHKDESQRPDAEPLQVIHFDPAGDPDAWPVGIFEEALEDLSMLRLAARQRGLS